MNLAAPVGMVSVLLLLAQLACSRGFADPTREYGPRPADGAGTVRVHEPVTLGVADTPQRDALGRPIGVACATCHGGDTPLVREEGNHEQVHREVELRHGALTCASCHDEQDRSLLRLADGQRLEMAEAMALCSQCHGTQRRDYDHGAHGGMTGHWDLRQGARDRNHCVDCHAPHEPAFVGGAPVHPPRDRFLGPRTRGH